MAAVMALAPSTTWCLLQELKVFVATTRQAYDDATSLMGAGPPPGTGDGMSRLQRRENSFRRRALVYRVQGFVVADRFVRRPLKVTEERVLGPYPRIVQAWGKGMGLENLSMFILEEGCHRPVQNSGGAVDESGRVKPGAAAGFNSEKVDVEISDESSEQPDRIGATPNTCHGHVGKPTHLFHDLSSRLLADHCLEFANQPRIRVWPDGRSEEVIGPIRVCDPRPECLVDCGPQCLISCCDKHQVGSEQKHSVDVRSLALGVNRSHIDSARKTHTGSGGRNSNTVLSGPCLRDDPIDAQPSRDESLAKGVVDLVGPGVTEILPFEINLGAPGGTQGRRRG
jgi:hypothetical protein